MKKASGILILLTAAAVMSAAQETAEKYFRGISEYYGTIRDYEGDLAITRGNARQTARISYRNPGMLHLAFSVPRGQVLNVNRETLEIYIPEYRVALVQELEPGSGGTLGGMANPQGLALMERYYSIAYAQGPEPGPLDEGSEEMVTKLKLNWRSTREGFRELLVSVGKDKLIRRIRGITSSRETIIFDFTNLEINKGIPETRFNYKSPPEGNAIENFLF